MEQLEMASELMKRAIEITALSRPAPTIDYDAIVRAAVRVVDEGRKKIFDKVLLTQHEAQESYGKTVIRALVKRGILQQYRFDTREAVDREGNPVTKAKGTIYYRLAEIENAVEEGNILKGTRRNTI